MNWRRPVSAFVIGLCPIAENTADDCGRTLVGLDICEAGFVGLLVLSLRLFTAKSRSFSLLAPNCRNHYNPNEFQRKPNA